MKRLTNVVVGSVAVVCLSAAMVACGSDDDDGGSSGTTTTEASGAETTADDAADTTTTAAEPGSEDGGFVVTASDYAFDVPESVPAGSKLTLANESEVELHEMVVLRFPDGETRTIDEVAELPEAEQEAVFGAGPPAIVQLQAPGGELIQAVGDGTLAEPGRYAVVCFIPVGVDPQEYLEASQEATDGPPQIEGAGPPHFTKGMFAELTVE